MLINVKTGETVGCYYRKLGKKEITLYKPPRWVFNFVAEFKDQYEVFAMYTHEYPDEVQGAVALRVEHGTVHLKLIEASNYNKYFIKGKKKNGVNSNRKYTGVGMNLVAFACQYSIDCNCEGHIYLKSKSSTISYYLGIGGTQFSRDSQMVLFDEAEGRRLAATHFPGGGIEWGK